MEKPTEIRGAIESEIRMAFRGVTLGRGISLSQAGSPTVSKISFGTEHSASDLEITDDWSRIPLDKLESDCIAQLDARGFRYYIPALMLSVLNHHDASSMRVIGTLAGLYPKKDNSWEYHMHRYSLLDDVQKAAIARFLAVLPNLVDLDSEGQKVVSRALRNYWAHYLQMNATEF
jgi:hypothetical protein